MTKGIIYVITGDGKGKTTAAFGLALRAAGHNQRTLIIQFIKGSWKSGEVKYIENYIPEIDVYVLGNGFIGIIDDKKPKRLHRKSAIKAFSFAKEKMKKQKYDIIILDEINVALKLKLLKIDEVIEFIGNKPKHLHIILTGRSAPRKLIKLADMVSEIKNIKHPYNQGILAQEGIDF